MGGSCVVAVVALLVASPTGGESVTLAANATPAGMAIIAKAKAHSMRTGVRTVCAGPSLAGWERPSAPGLNSLERHDPTMPNASNCPNPPGVVTRRDPLSIRKRASDDCSFKNSLVFVSKAAWYSFQKQPGIRFKNSLVSVSKTAWYPFQNSLVSVSKAAWYPVRCGASDTTVGVGGLRLRTSPQRGGGAPPIAPVERDCRRLTVRSRRTHLPCVRDLRTSRTLRRPALHASASVHALPALLRMRRGAGWAPLSLISSLAGRRGGIRSRGETPRDGITSARRPRRPPRACRPPRDRCPP